MRDDRDAEIDRLTRELATSGEEGARLALQTWEQWRETVLKLLAAKNAEIAQDL